MKTNKFLYVPVLFFVLVSCNKTTSPTTVSSTSAKSTFSNVNTDIATAVKALNESPGTLALNSFERYLFSVNPLARVRSYNTLKNFSDVTGMIHTKIAPLRTMLLKNSATARVEGSTPLDFKSNTGTYSWNPNKGTWDFVADPTGSAIKFDYPFDATSSTNDTELQIKAYTEAKFGNNYYPTHIELAIYKPIGGTKEVDLSFTASDYNDDNGNANKESIICYINPYSISFNLDNTQSLIANASCSLIKGSTTYINTNLALTFATAVDQTAGGNPNKVTGFLQLKNTKFNAVIDRTKLSSSTDLNDYANITVTIDGGSAGHVIWVTDPQSKQQVPYVEYNDKTKDSLAGIFADLQTQLSSFGFKFL